VLVGLGLPPLALAAVAIPPLTGSWLGWACVGVFIAAYTLVIFEEQLHLAKSKPVLLAAGTIWGLIAWQMSGDLAAAEAVEEALQHNFLEYAELFFFLLVAMTYINALIERGVFDALVGWLCRRETSYRGIFWLTGVLAFFLSPVADNLTTALILCTVVLAISDGSKGFVPLCCINIVIAANAGGAFSPFGDITTLMVWQKGVVGFSHFSKLFIPAIVNFLVPALIMQFALPSGKPLASTSRNAEMKPGGYIIAGLFLLTIVTAVTYHTALHLPPVIGMMMGLAFLKLFGYYLKLQSKDWDRDSGVVPGSAHNPYEFNVFSKIAKAEWDTLFFFYGVILSVGGLGYLGYLELVSHAFYTELGPTTANILFGILSAVIDNIPVMFAVLTMNPNMPETQWLLVTLTAGVGGSLLSVGSAAGVALMGQARGQYTFMAHMKWSPVIALGYFASIGVHLLLNGS